MKKQLIVVLGVLFIFSMIYAANPTFIGVNKCKMCHKGAAKGEVYEKWLKSTHAKAFDSLKAKGEEKNPKCLECHVTGFNAGGYKVGDATAAEFVGVQCESCHGAGSNYKSMSIMKDKQASIKNGLIEPNEALCKKCHNKNSPTFKGFDLKTYMAKIDHKY